MSRPIVLGGWDGPESHSLCGKPPPVEQLSRVFRARWSDVGVGEYAVGRNPMPIHDPTGQSGECRHLDIGKWPVAPFMPRVDQFHTDRPAVDVALPPPVPGARMPRPPV